MDSELKPSAGSPSSRKKKRQRTQGRGSDSPGSKAKRPRLTGASSVAPAAPASSSPSSRASKRRKAGGVKPEPGGGQEADGKPSDDHDILTSLFQKTGVHTAFSHDKIMQADSHVAENIAKKAARECSCHCLHLGFTPIATGRAVEALKRSRQHMRGAQVHEPTWTGRSGSAGAQPQQAPKFGTKQRAVMYVLFVCACLVTCFSGTVGEW